MDCLPYSLLSSELSFVFPLCLFRSMLLFFDRSRAYWALNTAISYLLSSFFPQLTSAFSCSSSSYNDFNSSPPSLIGISSCQRLTGQFDSVQPLFLCICTVLTAVIQSAILDRKRQCSFQQQMLWFYTACHHASVNIGFDQCCNSCSFYRSSYLYLVCNFRC